MVLLDSDDRLLKDEFGNVAERDIVQFVPFEEFGRNPFKLREEVLQELPDQVVGYYLSRGIKPSQGFFFNFFNKSGAGRFSRVDLCQTEYWEFGPRIVCESGK